MKAGSARSSFFCLQLPEYPADNQPAQHKCTEISDGLGNLNAEQTPDARENEQRGNQEDALTRGRDDGRAHAVANRLREHIAHGDVAPKRERQQLETQGKRADFDDLRIVAAEQGDDLAGKI